MRVWCVWVCERESVYFTSHRREREGCLEKKKRERERLSSVYILQEDWFERKNMRPLKTLSRYPTNEFFSSTFTTIENSLLEREREREREGEVIYHSSLSFFSSLCAKPGLLPVLPSVCLSVVAAPSGFQLMSLGGYNKTFLCSQQPAPCLLYWSTKRGVLFQLMGE